VNPNTIPEPMRGLLAAILEALDIPNPATVGDTEAHDRLLNDRVTHAAIALRSALDEHPDIAWDTQYLRKRLADHPPTGYRHWGKPEQQDETQAGAGSASIPPPDPAYAQIERQRVELETGFTEWEWAVGMVLCPAREKCTAGRLDTLFWR
jgi:hypothetical protein